MSTTDRKRKTYNKYTFNRLMTILADEIKSESEYIDDAKELFVKLGEGSSFEIDKNTVTVLFDIEELTKLADILLYHYSIKLCDGNDYFEAASSYQEEILTTLFGV